MRILYDSKSAEHKTPFGCVKENEECRMTVHIPESIKTRRAFLILKSDDEFLLQVPMQKTLTKDAYEHYTATFSLYRRGLYFYYFKIETLSGAFSLYKYGAHDTNMEDGSLWQLSCIKNGEKVDPFYYGAVYYQIFPDRFYKERTLSGEGKIPPFKIHENESDTPDYLPDPDGKILNNDFFGGNLAGIEKKLPYLKELGVKVIYLNPIFFAYSNHRYDTADYLKVDPLLGTESDFSSLCDAAHKSGMRVILDGVFSHTGVDSVYFDKNNRFGNGAYSCDDSPYKSWYKFGSDKSYTSWWGIDTLPCVNELSKSFTDFIIDSEDSVVAHWLAAGADGFRLDVADELPDEFILRLHDRVHALKKGAIVIGEVWEDASNKISYGVRRSYFTEAELDSVMNYPFRSAITDFVTGKLSSSDFSESVMTICENYPKEVLDCLMNSLSTHDTERVLTLLSEVPAPGTREERAAFTLSDEDRQKALIREKAAAFLQFMLPGSPCIYYGDEAGEEGFEDPFNRRFFPWGREERSLAEFYKKLASLKNTNEALRFGVAKVSSPEDGTVVIRRSANGKTLCAALSLKGGFTVSGKIIFSNAKGGALPENGFALYEE